MYILCVPRAHIVRTRYDATRNSIQIIYILSDNVCETATHYIPIIIINNTFFIYIYINILYILMQKTSVVYIYGLLYSLGYEYKQWYVTGTHINQSNMVQIYQ
jgi:hypothetical protein